MIVSSFLLISGYALGQGPVYYVQTGLNGTKTDKTRYFHGDTIHAPQRSWPLELTVFAQGGKTALKQLRWQWGVSTGMSGASQTIKLDSLGHSLVKIFRGDSLLLAITVAVYPMPVFYFQRGYDYDGEYGYDDSTHQYLHIRNNPQYAYGYQVKKMPGDTAYFVPWMSLLHGQGATIRYRIKHLSAMAQQDRNGYIELHPEAGSHIRINGAATARFYFDRLKANGSLEIKAEQWVDRPDSLKWAGDFKAIVKGVYVITHMGDTIGKLNLTCAKPEIKQVVFVYVNVGRGFDSSVLNRVNMLRQINKHSHNQLMRQWVINHDFPDTLNLTAAYFANPRQFNVDTMPELLKEYYKAHTGIDITTANRFRGSAKSANFIRFVFISHLIYPKLFILRGYPWIRWLNGVTIANYAALFESANLKTVCHELGHLLKLDHTDEPPFNIVDKATQNVMDYSFTGFQTIFNRFWYAQWVKAY